MKKSIYRFSIFFLIFFLAFSSFPFPKVNAADSHLNFIDFLRTNLGLVKIDNGSLSSLDRADFIDSLYNTSLAWEDNGTTFSFVPANVFTRSEWYSLATTGLTPSQDLPQYDGYNLRESLILSDYIQDTGTGLDLSDFPKLENNIDTVSPLDGVEVKTNFSDYNNYSDLSYRPSYNSNFINSLKNQYLSYSNRLLIISGAYDHKPSTVDFYPVRNCFYSISSNYDYYSLIKSNPVNDSITYTLYAHNSNNSNWWNTSNCYSVFDSSYGGNKNSYYYNNSYPDYFYSITDPLYYESSITSLYNYARPMLFVISDFPVTFWCSSPLIIASSVEASQNYYYWMRGIPSGSYYTTSNVNQVYSYDYVTNNNWETAYNNYITDVSNYYNTTENITNEQISNFIDNSTTINNITNNYINNESGGGGESGDNSDIIDWLKLMYDKLDDIESNTYGIDGYLEVISRQLTNIQDKLTDIFYWMAGKASEPGEKHYTNDSIINDILKFPEENLFPNVPDENFISSEDLEGIVSIPWELISSKIGSVVSEVVPFCYLFTLSSFMGMLVAPPSAPYYEIPFVIESYNINETVIIDLTGETWQVLHGIWIALFMIMFVAFLFYLTHKVLLLISNMFV